MENLLFSRVLRGASALCAKVLTGDRHRLPTPLPAPPPHKVHRFDPRLPLPALPWPRVCNLIRLQLLQHPPAAGHNLHRGLHGRHGQLPRHCYCLRSHSRLCLGSLLGLRGSQDLLRELHAFPGLGIWSRCPFLPRGRWCRVSHCWKASSAALCCRSAVRLTLCSLLWSLLLSQVQEEAVGKTRTDTDTLK